MPLRAQAGYHASMNEPEQRKEDRYVETARDRRIANALLLFFVIVVVGGGIWLANAMFEQRQLDDCLAQGGRNCAPAIEAPPCGEGRASGSLIVLSPRGAACAVPPRTWRICIRPV